MIKNVKQKEGSTLDGTQLEIVVDGDNFEEMTSPATRQRVLTFARGLGFPVSGLSGIPHAYPVDKDGNTSDKMFTSPDQHKWEHWRADYVVQATAGR